MATPIGSMCNIILEVIRVGIPPPAWMWFVIGESSMRPRELRGITIIRHSAELTLRKCKMGMG